MCRCQRLKILNRHHRKNCALKPSPTTTLWRRHIRPVFAGPPPFGGPNRKARSQAFRDVPADRRSSQASITRLAMPPSATFPHARGSYAFLLPTSPSTFNTPS